MRCLNLPVSHQAPKSQNKKNKAINTSIKTSLLQSPLILGLYDSIELVSRYIPGAISLLETSCIQVYVCYPEASCEN